MYPLTQKKSVWFEGKKKKRGGYLEKGCINIAKSF